MIPGSEIERIDRSGSGVPANRFIRVAHEELITDKGERGAERSTRLRIRKRIQKRAGLVVLQDHPRFGVRRRYKDIIRVLRVWIIVRDHGSPEGLARLERRVLDRPQQPPKLLFPDLLEFDRPARYSRVASIHGTVRVQIIEDGSANTPGRTEQFTVFERFYAKRSARHDFRPSPKPSIPRKILRGGMGEKLENLRYFQAY